MQRTELTEVPSEVEILGQRVEFAKIRNPKLRRVICERRNEAACFFKDEHTDHHDRKYSDHTDYTDYKDYKDYDDEHRMGTF
jgi:hypothetical protein